MIDYPSRRRWLLAALTVALGAGGALADSEIHRCEDADGQVIYQDDPCPVEGRKRREPAIPDARPASQSQPRVPDPGRSPIVAPARATRRARVVPRPAPLPPPSPALERELPPVDPRFATPERTWETFVAAMGHGDRETALACLTATARDELGPMVESSSEEAMREFVRTFVRVEFEGRVGPFWSLRVVRPHARPTWIFLQRTEDGALKIAAI